MNQDVPQVVTNRKRASITDAIVRKVQRRQPNVLTVKHSYLVTTKQMIKLQKWVGRNQHTEEHSPALTRVVHLCRNELGPTPTNNLPPGTTRDIRVE